MRHVVHQADRRRTEVLRRPGQRVPLCEPPVAMEH